MNNSLFIFWTDYLREYPRTISSFQHWLNLEIAIQPECFPASMLHFVAAPDWYQFIIVLKYAEYRGWSSIDIDLLDNNCCLDFLDGFFETEEGRYSTSKLASV